MATGTCGELKGRTSSAGGLWLVALQLYPDSFTFGEGLLAGGSIPGARRLVFCAWSPQWESFYVSSMGGAAYTFHGVGVNYVALRRPLRDTQRAAAQP